MGEGVVKMEIFELFKVECQEWWFLFLCKVGINVMSGMGLGGLGDFLFVKGVCVSGYRSENQVTSFSRKGRVFFCCCCC